MIVRSTFFKLITAGIVICGVVVIILNLISYHQSGHDYSLLDDNNAYVMSNRDGDALIRIKADVQSNSKPAILYANDGKTDVPEVRIRAYMISMNHEQVTNLNFNNKFAVGTFNSASFTLMLNEICAENRFLRNLKKYMEWGKNFIFDIALRKSERLYSGFC
ncbi:unnamed protein product [Rotaria socialis]|uniref:Uncharacterized protein n=1 Tax=Rotaria socialis TaxID=392032 RepID=A0A822A3P7_9BILA|nr:unnamed protein product [Rotaria socialis]